MPFRLVFFIRFVLYWPEWASGDKKNLCSTLILSQSILKIQVGEISNNLSIIDGSTFRRRDKLDKDNYSLNLTPGNTN